MDKPLIRVWNKQFEPVGEVGAPISFEVTPRHNLIPTGTIVVSTDDPAAALLSEDGARVTVDYRGEQVFSGWVGDFTFAGPAQASRAEFKLEGDFVLLHDLIGWPEPANPISSQAGVDGLYKATGPLETVVKGIITANKSRYKVPVTVAPNLLRGPTISIESRFERLADVLMDKVEAAGYGISVTQSGAGLLVDVYQVQPFGTVIEEAAGSVQEWSWSRFRPANTRTVVGGQGEKDLRVFRQVIATATETTTARVIESFVDGEDTVDGPTLDRVGAENNKVNGRRLGLSLTIMDTPALHYGGADGLRVGDHLQFRIGSGLLIEDVLREVTITWTSDNGVHVSQKVGFDDRDPFARMARLLAAAHKEIRKLGGK